MPATLQLVKENGSWKIDLVTPSPAEKQVLAAREKARGREREVVTQFERRQAEMINAKCTNFHLLGNWTFQMEPIDGKIVDETGKFSAELLGAHIVEVPEGKALQFQSDKEALKLPEDLLNHRACGVITFWLRRDDSKTLNRVLLKVWPGSFSESGIEVHPDGRVHYNVQRNMISSNERLKPQRFYHLGFVWNKNGMCIYIDGKLDVRLEKPVHIAAHSTTTEMGRDPDNPHQTGSSMTIRDLKIYEGQPSDAELADVLGVSR